MEKFCEHLDDQKKSIRREAKSKIGPLEPGWKQKRAIVEEMGKKINGIEIDNLILELEKYEKDRMICELYGVIRTVRDKKSKSPGSGVEFDIRGEKLETIKGELYRRGKGKGKGEDGRRRGTESDTKKYLKKKADKLYDNYLENFEGEEGSLGGENGKNVNSDGKGLRKRKLDPENREIREI
jgi:hypothetical protein